MSTADNKHRSLSQLEKDLQESGISLYSEESFRVGNSQSVTDIFITGMAGVSSSIALNAGVLFGGNTIDKVDPAFPSYAIEFDGISDAIYLRRAPAGPTVIYEDKVQVFNNSTNFVNGVIQLAGSTTQLSNAPDDRLTITTPFGTTTLGALDATYSVFDTSVTGFRFDNDIFIDADLTVSGDYIIDGDLFGLNDTSQWITKTFLDSGNNIGVYWNNTGSLYELRYTVPLITWDIIGQQYFSSSAVTPLQFNSGKISLTTLGTPSFSIIEGASKDDKYVTPGTGASKITFGKAASAGIIDLWVSVTGNVGDAVSYIHGLGVDTQGGIYLKDVNTRVQKGLSNSIRLQTNFGYIDIGPQSTSTAHIQTDRVSFTLNKNLFVPTAVTVGTTSTVANSVVRVLSSDFNQSGFEAYGSSQGTGYFFAGQSASHGGGIYYDGDGSPEFISGGPTDTIGFYRTSASVKSLVFSYPFSSNTVTFVANPIAPGYTVNDTNTIVTEGAGNSIRLKTNFGYVDVGPQDSTSAHIQTDRSVFRFNKQINVNGQIVWNAGNDGSGSGLNADLTDGFHATSVSSVNTLAVRDSSSDISTRLFRSEYTITNPTVGFIMTQVDTGTGNNYLRPTTPTQLAAILPRVPLAFDSDTTDGFHANQAATANTLATRTVSGSVYATFFNMTANTVTPGPTKIAIETGNDSFLRWQTPANFISNLGLSVTTHNHDSIYAKLTGAAFTGTISTPSTIEVGANNQGNSEILFYDDFANTQRALMWSDNDKEWRVADNAGTMRTLVHSGNINSSIITNVIEATMRNTANGNNGSFTIVTYDSSGNVILSPATVFTQNPWHNHIDGPKDRYGVTQYGHELDIILGAFGYTAKNLIFANTTSTFEYHWSHKSSIHSFYNEVIIKDSTTIKWFTGLKEASGPIRNWNAHLKIIFFQKG